MNPFFLDQVDGVFLCLHSDDWPATIWDVSATSRIVFDCRLDDRDDPHGASETPGLLRA